MSAKLRLPPSAGDGFEDEVKRFVLEVIKNGQAILWEEPGIKQEREIREFVEGKHNRFPIVNERSKVVLQRTKKILMEFVAAMTDVRSVWEFRTFNAKFVEAANVLSKLSRAWWMNGQNDGPLADALTHAALGGSGYLLCYYDNNARDLRLKAYGAKHVIPFRPVRTGDLQDWGGVVIHERRSIADLSQEYPLKAKEIVESSLPWFPEDEKAGSSGPKSPLQALFGGRNPSATVAPGASDGTTDFIRFYFKDPALNVSGKTVRMGPEDKNWSYEVPSLGAWIAEEEREATEEDARLYPRGRLVVATPTTVFYDGPNPYWHKGFPLVQFTPDSFPWLLVGLPALADFLPIQSELNRLVQGIGNALRQHFKRGVLGDKTATAKTNMKAIDTEAAGFRLSYNANAGRPPQVIEGPNLPAYTMDFVRMLVEQGEEIMGAPAFRNLLALKQLPSSDAMQQLMDAMTPMLRLRIRSMERSLARLAELMKVNFFQFYDAKRRVEILGDNGYVVEEFDFDPSSLVPGEKQLEGVPPSEDYDPDYDVDRKTPFQRAEKFSRNFAFTVAPYSFLNLGHMQTKLMHLQMFAKGIMDPYTVWQSFDVPGIGPLPAETIPERIEIAKQKGLMMGPVEMERQIQLMMAQAQAQAMMAQLGGGGAAPAAPPPPPPGPPGRPPSFQRPPQLETRPTPEGGVRPVVSTSSQGGE